MWHLWPNGVARCPRAGQRACLDAMAGNPPRRAARLTSLTRCEKQRVPRSFEASDDGHARSPIVKFHFRHSSWTSGIQCQGPCVRAPPATPSAWPRSLGARIPMPCPSSHNDTTQATYLVAAERTAAMASTAMPAAKTRSDTTPHSPACAACCFCTAATARASMRGSTPKPQRCTDSAAPLEDESAAAGPTSPAAPPPSPARLRRLEPIGSSASGAKEEYEIAAAAVAAAAASPGAAPLL